MRCYNSGPISSLPLSVAMNNFRRADVIIDKRMGMRPVNPLITWALPRRSPWLLHMIKDLLLLLTCRSIYFQSGWSRSRGARVEHRVAEWLGMSRYYEEVVLCDNSQ